MVELGSQERITVHYNIRRGMQLFSRWKVENVVKMIRTPRGKRIQLSEALLRNALWSFCSLGE